MMSEEPNTNAQETYAPPHKVLTNDDLLTEIFIRLPILYSSLYPIRSSFDCDFVSLDPRINSRKYTIENSFTLGSNEEADKVKILQSCNDYANVDSDVYGYAGLRLAFDPTKSPYYKVVRAGRTLLDTRKRLGHPV
ncbi:hypothetical protein Tco_1559586, partial [Tanacetum coccineum]